MKRHPDVSHPDCETARDAANTIGRCSARPAPVETATVMLAHAIYESEASIARLSDAMSRIAQALAEIGVSAQSLPHAPPAPGLQSHHEELTAEIALCIENLQFQDRLMQQLNHVRELLATGPGDAQSAAVPALPANKGSIELF